MTDTYVPFGVHLVGSVPLRSAEEVFRALSAELGTRIRRIPDGETGPRADWIVWQYPVLSSRPQFEVTPPTPGSYRALPRLRLRPDADELRFGSLGYADAAQRSYAVFAPLKRDGVIPRGCRFQVSLPTPLAPVSAFVAGEDQASVERAYEAAMLLEVEQILDALPHDQLALQWDTNVEFGMLGGDLSAWFPDVKAGILERLVRISGAVPPAVELGFISAWATTSRSNDTYRPTPGRWLTSRTRSPQHSSARSTGSRCRSRGIAPTRRSWRRSAISGSTPRPSSTSGPSSRRRRAGE